MVKLQLQNRRANLYRVSFVCQHRRVQAQRSRQAPNQHKNRAQHRIHPFDVKRLIAPPSRYESFDHAESLAFIALNTVVVVWDRFTSWGERPSAVVSFILYPLTQVTY